MQAIVISTVKTICGCLVATIGRQFSYLSQLTETLGQNVETLKNELGKLRILKTDVEEKVRVAEDKGETISNEVKAWLERAGSIEGEANQIVEDTDRFLQGCLSKYLLNIKSGHGLSTRAEQKTHDIVRLQREWRSIKKKKKNMILFQEGGEKVSEEVSEEVKKSEEEEEEDNEEEEGGGEEDKEEEEEGGEEEDNEEEEGGGEEDNEEEEEGGEEDNEEEEEGGEEDSEEEEGGGEEDNEEEEEGGEEDSEEEEGGEEEDNEEEEEGGGGEEEDHEALQQRRR